MSGVPRIVIIGGVAGGASAAARARRLSENASIVLLERGPHVSFANCGLPYHIGGLIADRAKLLLQTPQSLKARFGIDVRVRNEAIAIDVAARQVVARNLVTGEEVREPYDALILSPGAAPIRPPVPGVDLEGIFTLRNLEDMDSILARAAHHPEGRALVVGAGYIGLEMAEQLRHRGLAVTLVERLPQVLAVADAEMAFPLQEELARQGVDLHLGRSVAAFEGAGAGLVAVLDDGMRIACELAVLSVGVRPETRLAQTAGLALGSIGGILVDDSMRTSDPHIYAVGDAVEVREFVSGEPALIPWPAQQTVRAASPRRSSWAGTAATRPPRAQPSARCSASLSP